MREEGPEVGTLLKVNPPIEGGRTTIPLSSKPSGGIVTGVLPVLLLNSQIQGVIIAQRKGVIFLLRGGESF